jgi:two-component system, response regulator RegA
MKFLVVDDDDCYRELLVQSLAKRGHEARGACNALDARAVAKEFNPDRAVVDLRMEGPSGLELIRWLKEDDAQIRIVVLTGFGSIATTQEAIKRGADAYLTKPCSIERVLAAFEDESPGLEVIPSPTLEQVEWEHMQRVLTDCDGNISKSARVLGVDRRSLQRKLAKSPRLQ